jgi:hypothetical protein
MTGQSVYFDEACAAMGLSPAERANLPQDELSVGRMVWMAVTLIEIYPHNKLPEVVALIGPDPTLKDMLIAGDVDAALSVVEAIANTECRWSPDTAPQPGF